MRIVGGTLSGRKLLPPHSMVTRPMLDRIREALFNILAHRDWPGVGELFAPSTHVVDAFCGTGALAFEALSWGAGSATLFDRDRGALSVAHANAEALGLKDRSTIQMADSTQPPRASKAAKLVFLAPPYRKGLVAPTFAALDQAGWIGPNAVVVVETARKEELPEFDGFPVQVERFYGDTALRFLARQLQP